MNDFPPSQLIAPSGSKLSSIARQKITSLDGEPFLLSHWKRAVFIHFETDAEVLQREIPFELDLRDGKAYVSLVAFSLERMRPRIGGKLSEWLMSPIGTHNLLNIRTYVRHEQETGIYFLAEFLPNKISLHLGPWLYGLPYRYGELNYDHAFEQGRLSGEIVNGRDILSYHAPTNSTSSFRQCESGTLDEFLIERYSAFTHHTQKNRVFRIWHPPWSIVPANVKLEQCSLLRTTGQWFRHARLIGGHYSPGFENVWMSRPRKLG